jgi:hypothetical protein
MSDPLAALRAVSGNDPSSGATTLPNIPAVPYTDDASLTNILSAMKLWMDKAAGSGLTGFASKQDLIDAGVLTKDPSGNIKPTADTSMAIPPVPSGLTASGAMTIILLEWDDPRLAYSNHGYTEIWAAEVDNFSSAQLVGQSSGVIFVHAVGEGSQRYYWIRFVSTAGVMGPYNAVGGTLGQTAQNPAYLLDAMSGILDEQPFFTVETPTEINGVTIPVGTYMKSAFIHDAFITSAMIYELSADKITTGTLAAGRIATNSITADKINGTNLAVVNGTFSGSLQAATGTFTGALSAATGTFSGRLTAGTIDPGAFAGIVQNYGTPGTYTVTVPSGTGWSAINMRFTLQGAGGGGGGGAGSANSRMTCSGGGGGAGSSITVTIANVTPGSTYGLTIGAGGYGAPVSTTGQTGGWGGSTTLAGYVANGGQPGTGGDPYRGVAGVGGSIGGGSGITSSDMPGYMPWRPGGYGGSSAFGGGGGPDSAGGIGAGGGGGSAGEGDVDRGGAPGGGGMAIIEFYDPNAVVTNTRYSNLIAWLDGVGHGAVPANAR